MNEFDLIGRVVGALGEVSSGGELRVGPGDDASVSRVPQGCELVSSIDTLVAGRHFPEDADPERIGYRAMMVSVSDLAAMGAEPGVVLVALSLEQGDPDWVEALARGLRRAALEVSVKVAGGNFARGPLALSVSVHGYVPIGQAVTRSGAQVGDGVYVTGPLGGAAAALAAGLRDETLNQRYYAPLARVDLAAPLRDSATSAIDISDGLLQDAGHLASASGCALSLAAESVPVFAGASLEHALSGGDDYELCLTAASPPPFTATRIGEVVAGSGVLLDGRPVPAQGYQHFE